MSHKLKAAVFDMDGLLIDSEPVWMQVEADVVRALYGIDLSSAELRKYQGSSTHAFCEGIKADHPEANVDADQLWHALIEQMGEAIPRAPLLTGAREILHWCVDQKIPTAIASSSPMSFIESVVEAHNLPVRVLTSGTEVKRSKPHPAVFELCASRLFVEPWQCMVWEDSINGVIAGRAAGATVIAVPERKHPTPEAFSIAHRRDASLLVSLNHLSTKGLSLTKA
jgi:beta-phosphoglucomutase-like phosphatase (HAD superfamily)